MEARKMPGFARTGNRDEEIHDKAWAFLHDWELAPKPYAYEIAYLYFEGGYEDIINEPLDLAIAKSDTLCDYDVQQIHSSLRGGLDSELWQKLDQEFVNISNLVDRQASSSDTYSKSLRERSETISSVSTIEQFRDMVSGLIRENERILSETSNLRSELKRSSTQIDELRNKLEESRDKELQDPLTRIGNRRFFDEWLERELFAADRDGKPLCLALADIDHFKRINDTFGHPVGDAVLCFFAQLIQSNVKGRDRVARYGGEEFALILPETKLRGAVKLVDRIRRDLHARNIVIVEDQMDIGKVTTSFGVTEFHPGDTVEALIKKADTKLYEAKHSGRNCVKF